MPPILGLVSIGQSPRPDYIEAFQPYAPNAEIRVAGALDNLSDAQINAYTGTEGDYPLLVRLANGRPVEIDLSVLAPLVEKQAQRLAEAGASLVVVMCAGGFPDIACTAPVLLPGQILPAVVKAICKTMVIGVVTPIKGQVDAADRKWREDGFQPSVTWAAPHLHHEIETAADRMADPSLEIIILDCMGHDETYRTEFARRCGRPVVLAQSLVARVAGELVAG
jgi:protein AroM